MPTIYEEGGYAFRLRSSDGGEPPHVHVEGHEGAAKFWLPHVGLARSRGYNRRQLRKIARIIERRTDEFLDRWHEFFG